MTKTKEEPIFIRSARMADAEGLALLHFRAYANRFFDPQARDRNGILYGAPLAREFPALAKGQNEAYFRQYWVGFVRKLVDPDPRERNYCHVALAGQKLLAFVKGGGAPVSKDPTMRAILRQVFRNAASCSELGSVYCDPDAKYRGLGRSLTARFAACMTDLGYSAMITRAYAKNDSPAFFEKLGARYEGPCDIPNDYLTPEGKLATLSIPGVWLYWDRTHLLKLAAECK